jgi:hypothetical protein
VVLDAFATESDQLFGLELVPCTGNEPSVAQGRKVSIDTELLITPNK